MVIFGAGGPLAAAAARALAPAYRLRLTDVRPLADLEQEGRPQTPGAPCRPSWGRPTRPLSWTWLIGQVHAPAPGWTPWSTAPVVRPDPLQAFRVNTLGAIHVLQVPRAHGIRRVGTPRRCSS